MGALLLLSAALCAGAPSGAAESGMSGKAALSIEATTPQGQFALTGSAAFEQRSSLFRFDITSLSLSDPKKAGAPLSPLPPGGYSFVYDASSLTYTIWSSSRRTYYTGKSNPVPKATATPRPSAPPSPSPSATPANLASFLAQLKDLQQFVLSLTLSPDKAPIEGHPTTNFDFRFTRQLKAQDPLDVSGRASFADDLGGVPLLFTVRAVNGQGGSQSGSVRAALSDVKQQAPPASDFVPPPGYKRGASVFDVIVIPSPGSPPTP